MWLWLALAASAVACVAETAVLCRHLGQRSLEELRVPLLSAPPGSEEPPKQFHATIWGLLRLSTPDSHLLALGFVGGVGGAFGNSLIPYFSGKVRGFAAAGFPPPAP